jgi:hypothetical protein
MADEGKEFTGISDVELKKTIQSLQEEEKRRREEKLSVRRELNRRAHSLLIKVWPDLSRMFDHGRTSCSDENPGNGGLNPRCVKCRLMEIVKMDPFEAEDIVIEFTASFHRLEDG